MTRLRIAQYGTKHGHAAGKLAALRRHPRVEFSGVYEPDAAQRARVQSAGWPFDGIRWYDDPREFLDDPTIVAVAAEGRNHESLEHTARIVAAGKHVWYDKPAGDDWRRFVAIASAAERRGLTLQMGYMFRYHDGFRRIAAWARSGMLGRVFAIRAHMSTWIPLEERREQSRHRGGILYDLGGHMLDQIVWLLGRPIEVKAFLAGDAGMLAGYHGNTVAVCTYPEALALVDIAAMETPPVARRFEVYGTSGSAIMEPFEPARRIRLCLNEASGDYQRGEQVVPVRDVPRDTLYERELDAFVAVVRGERAPDRPLAHELMVQETLLRATGGIDNAPP